jgi:hypothetical protein
MVLTGDDYSRACDRVVIFLVKATLRFSQLTFNCENVNINVAADIAYIDIISI